ncbi:MAG: MerR family transcriptional regulator [Anaerolineae bacterium]|nr:MerR family transcriptional regulator [Anaerolineae bacterium]
MRTKDIARELGIHVNTVRLYEASKFISPVPRGSNGYREYSPLHLEQARLTHLATRWPYIGDKTVLIELVTNAACGDLGVAMELAYRYLALVRVEKTYAEAAIEFLERWAAGQRVDVSHQTMHIRQAATHLNVSVDMLRNWERNGLIIVPRDPVTHYRRYGSTELGRLRIIRALVQSGFSLMAILQMLRRVDDGSATDLREALTVPPDENVTQIINIVADRRLASLLELEERAQAVIRQIGKLIDMAHAG